MGWEKIFEIVVRLVNGLSLIWALAALGVITALVASLSFLGDGNLVGFLLGGFAFAVSGLGALAFLRYSVRPAGGFLAVGALAGAMVGASVYVFWSVTTLHNALIHYQYVCDGDTSSSGMVSWAIKGDWVGLSDRPPAMIEPRSKPDDPRCSDRSYRVTYTITPIERISELPRLLDETPPTGDNGKTGAAENVSASFPFSYRRSSCSGRSNGEFRACLPDGVTVKEVTLNRFSARNGRLEPASTDKTLKVETASGLPLLGPETGWRLDTTNKSCAIIPWSAASGGRTFIGECRYHGAISFDVTLEGMVDAATGSLVPGPNDETGNGPPAETTTTRRGSSTERTIPLVLGQIKGMSVRYDVSDLNLSSVVGWDYSLRVERFNTVLGRDHQEWTDAADAKNDVTPCLWTSIDPETGTLTFRVRC